MVLQIADYFRKLSRRERGFTLIELVIVVAIIAILIAVAIPIYQNVTRSAAEKSHDTNLRTIDSAVMQYFMAEGEYPLDASGNGDIGLLLSKGFLKEMPEIPDLVITNLSLTGENTKYSLVGKDEQPWAAPVGDWGGYRSSTPN